MCTDCLDFVGWNTGAACRGLSVHRLSICILASLRHVENGLACKKTLVELMGKEVQGK